MVKGWIAKAKGHPINSVEKTTFIAREKTRRISIGSLAKTLPCNNSNVMMVRSQELILKN